MLIDVGGKSSAFARQTHHFHHVAMAGLHGIVQVAMPIAELHDDAVVLDLVGMYTGVAGESSVSFHISGSGLCRVRPGYVARSPCAGCWRGCRVRSASPRAGRSLLPAP